MVIESHAGSRCTEHVGKWCKLYFDEGNLLVFSVPGLVAVAALEAVQHGGDGEGEQQQPDDDGDVRGLLEGLEEVLPARPDHVEVAVDGDDSEEGDAGPAVQEHHEEHGLAGDVLTTSSRPAQEVVCLEREAEEKQDVGQDHVEEADVVAVCLPKLQLEDEQMENRRIQRQSQYKDDDHNSCIDFIERFVGHQTVHVQLWSSNSHRHVLHMVRY